MAKAVLFTDAVFNISLASHWISSRTRHHEKSNTRSTGNFTKVKTPLVSFFFQAEDGIRDYKVTGVQTCALPILVAASAGLGYLFDAYVVNIYSFVLPLIAADLALSDRIQGVIGSVMLTGYAIGKIGRASCRERV